MADVTARRATYDDILALPPHVTGQIADGELFTSPRPAGDHAIFTSGLGADLGGPFMRGRGGPGGWWIVDEPELHLDDDVLVPDLAGWRRERLPEYPAGAFVTVAPDWVCEVLSPATARFDRTRKMSAYARAAVSHLWLVDPHARTLESYRLESGRWLVAGSWGEDDVVRAEPFAVVEVALGTLWL
jgi:Uma2 family endonuclease